MPRRNEEMQKAYSLIGLAKRAGKAVCGEGAVKDSIRYGKAQLVIIAEDASDNTKKSVSNSCIYYNVPYYICGTKSELGNALGKEINASICISDRGFAKSIEKHLQSNTNGGEVL